MKLTWKQSLLIVWAAAVFLFLHSLPIPVEASFFQPELTRAISQECQIQEQISSGSSIERIDAAVGSFLRSAFSLTKMGQENRSSKEEYRTYFYSVFAVLVKTATIPAYILMTIIGAGSVSVGVNSRIMMFIHDTDGEKETSAS